MRGRDENSVKDVQPVFLSLRKIAEETCAAIVVIHHANKCGSYRGSTAIKGSLDLLVSVESKTGTNEIAFRTDKAHDSLPVHFGATAACCKPWRRATQMSSSGPMYLGCPAPIRAREGIARPRLGQRQSPAQRQTGRAQAGCESTIAGRGTACNPGTGIGRHAMIITILQMMFWELPGFVVKLFPGIYNLYAGSAEITDVSRDER
jgi:hypothetical protein